jgi:hypothetical protein
MGWASGTEYFDYPLDLMLQYVPEGKRREVIEKLYWSIRNGDWDTVDESAYIDLLIEYNIDGLGDSYAEDFNDADSHDSDGDYE